MLKLRDYQEKAIEGLYTYLKTKQGNPCVVAPTGSGKAILIAKMVQLCVEDWGGRVLILAHVKELLEQEGEKLSAYLPEIEYKYYSAGIGQKDFDSQVVIAGIQSIYQHAEEAGKFDLIMVDECHLIPPDGDGMYRTFLSGAMKVNPKVRLVGFTATPFRTGTGSIVGENCLLTEIAHEIPVRELIDRGYLSQLKMKGSAVEYDTSKLHIQAGEFKSNEVEELIVSSQSVLSACRDVVSRTQDRKSVLIFASSVKHAEMIKNEIEKLTGERCEIITGETSAEDRDRINKEFRGLSKDMLGDSVSLKYLVNVNVLTTGFDAPAIDCVVLLRPTASPGLYIQMVGRGLRIAEGKKDCLILDFGENVVRHGPIDGVFVNLGNRKRGEKVCKKCPKCQSVVLSGYSVCPDCGFEFPKNARGINHNETAGDGHLFVGEMDIEEHDVIDWRFREWKKRGWEDGDPTTIRIDYCVAIGQWYSQWVCPEHTGFARSKFEKWWEKVTDVRPIPTHTKTALMYLECDKIARPQRVRVIKRSGERFSEVEVIQYSEIEEQQCRERCGKCLHLENGRFCAVQNIEKNPTDESCENFYDVNDYLEEDLPF